MKSKAITSVDTSIHSIVAEGLATVPDPVSMLLPKINSIKRGLRRVRTINRVSDPAIPSSVSDFIVLGNDDPNPILIFSTRYSFNALFPLHNWFADGTFHECPSIFGQIHTIHALYEGKVVTLVYSLLPNKSQATYKRFLESLKTLRQDLQPESIMMDMQLEFANACNGIFNAVNIRFCLFYAQQATHPKTGTLGLKSKYETDDEFNHKVKTLVGLSFVTPAHVQKNFKKIVNERFITERDPAADDLHSCLQRNSI